jgi:hypothetical protein
VKFLTETSLILLDSRRCRNKPVSAKTVIGEVVLSLFLVNVSIFVQEIVDDGFQSHLLPLSVSGNSNMLL